jgi:BirA family biotin operon repressor/biotin-[acetyl-CoA-carboxylase] ligase
MPGDAATGSGAFREWSDTRLAGTRFTSVRWFAEIDSTNRYLLHEASLGAAEGLVAVADVQTAGRGRMGRTWVAPPGASLLVSALLRPALPADRVHLVTLAAALAALDAVQAGAGVEAGVKWPNDVAVDDRKLAGILAEATGGAVVVGMGLNVQWERFPDDIAATATACNLCGTRPADREDLLARWLHAFDARLDALDGVVAEVAARSATLGRRVRVELANETLEARAERLTDEGYLVVTTDDGRERVVTAGDVVNLRPADR